MPTYSEGQLSEDFVWVLTVRWASRTWRFASEQVLIATAEGDALLFAAGMSDPEISDEVRTGDVAPELRSVSLTVYFPQGVDVAALVAQGHSLAAATAELALWPRDAVWEERLQVISGRMSRPRYGEVGDPVVFSIRETLVSETGQHPPHTHKVSADTWQNHFNGHEGQVYPQVWNSPGIMDAVGGGLDMVPATPALAVVYDTDFYEAVDAATESALTFASAPSPYTTVTIATSPLIVDSVTLSVGDRLLIKDQTGTGTHGAHLNGIWRVTISTGGSTTLVRASDMSDPSEVVWGRGVEVLDGLVNAGTRWEVDSAYTSASFGQAIYFQTYESKADELLAAGHQVEADFLTLIYDIELDEGVVRRFIPLPVTHTEDARGVAVTVLDLRDIFPGSRKRPPDDFSIGWGQRHCSFGGSLAVRSTSSSDTAIDVTVYGRGTSYIEFDDTVTLTGTTPASVTGTWGRVEDLEISAAPVGDVFLQDTTTGHDVYVCRAGTTTFVDLVAETGGGHPGVKTLGDLVTWWSRLSSLAWDTAALQIARTRLTHEVSGWINEAGVKPTDFVYELLKPYPAQVVQQGGKLVVVSYIFGTPVATLTEGGAVERTAGPEHIRDGEDVVTRLSLEWAIDRDKTVLRTSILQAEREPGVSDTHASLTLARAVAEFGGEQAQKDLTGHYIWRETAALRVLRELAEFFASSPRRLSFTAKPEWIHVPMGATVELVAATLSITSTKCLLLERKATDQGLLEVTLQTQR